MGESTLAQNRSGPLDIFPSPADGDVLEVTPPSFHWLPVDDAAGYRVIVQDATGHTVVDAVVPRNYLLLREALPVGRYRWNLHAGPRQRGWWTFEIAAGATQRIPPTADEVLASMPPSHPRHVFYPQDIPGIIASHARQIEVLRQNIAIALENGPPPRPAFHRKDKFVQDAPSYRLAFGEYRDFVDRDLVACALGHLLLKDAGAAEHARASLLTICDWNPEGPCAVDGPWGDEIGLSNARCLFAVYDWTFDLYSEKEHLYIQRTLAQYARQIVRRLEDLDFFARPGSSHAGRIPAYLGEAALVLHGHIGPAETRQWLQYALDVYSSFFPFYGDSDGGWAEGTFYGSSYTKWYLPFFFAIERHSGFSFLEHPFYRRVSQFFLHFGCPSWEIHPFCDGYWCLPEDQEWPGFFAQAPFGVYAERFGPDLARRVSAAIAPRLYKLHLLDVFRRKVPAMTQDAAGPAENSRHFRETGFVSIHSDIADPAGDTALLVRASKFGTASHQHADQGSFAVISRGKGLICPSGYFGDGYGTDHHRQWTRQTIAHNCLLIGGQGQPAGSHRTTGRIEYLRDEGAWAMTSLDLAGAYPQLRHYRRQLLFVRPGLILVHDDLSAGEPVEIAWLAHSLSAPTIAGQTVRIARAPASLEMQLFGAPGESLSFAWTDQFNVDTVGPLEAALHAKMRHPLQYHMTWHSLELAPAWRFCAVLAVNGADVRTEWSDRRLVITYGSHEVSVDLEASRLPTLCMGRQIL